MIAKVRHYEYADILDIYTEFENLSRTVKIMDTVKLMKKVVPELNPRIHLDLKFWISNRNNL